MKRYFAVWLVICSFAVMMVGCRSGSLDSVTTATSATTTTVTPIVTTNHTTTTTFTEGIGGGDDWDYARSYHLNFSIDGFVEQLVEKDKYSSWIAQFDHMGGGGTRNRRECNYYEFIKDFSIPRKDLEALCANYENTITPAEIALLYTGTRLEVYQYFANPYAVMVGVYAYSPKWLTEHTAAEYREVGITYDLLMAKLNNILGLCTASEQAHIRTQCQELAP